MVTEQKSDHFRYSKRSQGKGNKKSKTSCNRLQSMQRGSDGNGHVNHSPVYLNMQWMEGTENQDFHSIMKLKRKKICDVTVLLPDIC